MCRWMLHFDILRQKIKPYPESANLRSLKGREQTHPHGSALEVFWSFEGIIEWFDVRKPEKEQADMARLVCCFSRFRDIGQAVIRSVDFEILKEQRAENPAWVGCKYVWGLQQRSGHIQNPLIWDLLKDRGQTEPTCGWKSRVLVTRRTHKRVEC